VQCKPKGKNRIPTSPSQNVDDFNLRRITKGNAVVTFPARHAKEIASILNPLGFQGIALPR
jgi:hypothetical protein